MIKAKIFLQVLLFLPVAAPWLPGIAKRAKSELFILVCDHAEVSTIEERGAIILHTGICAEAVRQVAVPNAIAREVK